MHIVLGSQSEARKKILEEMGLSFEVMRPDVDEKMIRFSRPEELTLALAHAKARILVPQITVPSLLITSDQVIVCNGAIREKPQDEVEARRFLLSYRQYPVEAVNAVVVTNTQTGAMAQGIDRAQIYFHSFPDELITHLIEGKHVLYCAGALRAEHPLVIPYIEKMEGTIDSFMGLPKQLLSKLLKEV